MQKFRFKLEKILDLKQREEDKRQAEFKEAQVTYEQENEKLKILKKKCGLYRKGYHEAQLGRIEIEQVKFYQRYIYQLEDQIEREILQLKILGDRLNTAQENLLEAVKEKKKLEKLREKHIEDYGKMLKKYEQQQIDEISTMMVTHK